MTDAEKSLRQIAIKEGAILAILLFVGFLILPTAIYFVGQAVFGEYETGGFGGFFGSFHGELRALNVAVWFLVLSPYLLWQLSRVTVRAFRYFGRMA